MPEMASITLRAKVAWWVIPYIRCVQVFALLFGMEPDVKKVLATALKGIKVGL